MAAAAVAEAVPEAARSLAVASHLENDKIDKFELFNFCNISFDSYSF